VVRKLPPALPQGAQVTDYGPDSPRLVIKRASVDYRAEMFNGMDYVVTGRTRAFRTTSFTMEFAVWLPDPSGATCTATGEAIVVLLNRDAPGRYPIPEAGRTAFKSTTARRQRPPDPLHLSKNTDRAHARQGPDDSQSGPRTNATSCRVEPSFSAPSAAPVSTGSSASASSLPSSTPHWSKLLIPRITPSTKTRCS
jgi:hypothetical protein